MKNCLQSPSQSIYDHGLSVKKYTFDLIDCLENNQCKNYKLPDWFLQYRKEILQSLFSKKIIEEYTIFHDCSKPYCKIIDENGKQHFPNHADLSGKLWLESGGSIEASNLMKMDMVIHTMKLDQVDEFILYPEAITLLIVALSEINSNANMFGGIESVSFKIKWKQINKIGKSICHKLFGDV